MIIGVGTDIVTIARLQKVLDDFGAHALDRLFTLQEQSAAEQRNQNKMAFYAKRFAAKEAFAKAVGCGFGKDVSWTDIEVLNDTKGKPVIQLSGKTAAFVAILAPQIRSHLSLSDEGDVALAFVIVEAISDKSNSIK